MMFDIQDAGLEYIKGRGNTAVIELKHQAAIGDGILTGRRLTGCYVPAIRMRDLQEDETQLYRRALVRGVIIRYHPDLKAKAGYAKITILLKRLLWWEWLELEGASLLPVFGD